MGPKKIYSCNKKVLAGVFNDEPSFKILLLFLYSREVNTEFEFQLRGFLASNTPTRRKEVSLLRMRSW